jgi:hypothetical protein
MAITHTALALAALVMATTCGPEAGVVETSTVYKYDKTTFDREFAAWQAAGIKNYQYTFKYFAEFCGTLGPYTITVKEHAQSVITPVPNPNKASLITEDIDKVYADIKGFIKYIETIKENGGCDSDGDKFSTLQIEVEYDTVYHYPKYINTSVYYFQPINAEPINGGGGDIIEIGQFTPLK